MFGLGRIDLHNADLGLWQTVAPIVSHDVSCEILAHHVVESDVQVHFSLLPRCRGCSSCGQKLVSHPATGDSQLRVDVAGLDDIDQIVKDLLLLLAHRDARSRQRLELRGRLRGLFAGGGPRVCK
jgi:hypothetical protein